MEVNSDFFIVSKELVITISKPSVPTISTQSSDSTIPTQSSDSTIPTQSSDLTVPAQLNEPSQLTIKFGAKGCRFFVMNDVTVIPHMDSNVRIEFELKGLEPLIIETNELVNIFQRPTAPYPSFELNVNSNKYVKEQIYEGKIKILGNCDIVQKPFNFYDA